MKRKILVILALCSAYMLSAQVAMTVDFDKRGTAIAPTHYGIFYEDINHSADGGLYAELIRNRSFEDAVEYPYHWNLLCDKANGYIELVCWGQLNKSQKQCLKVELRDVASNHSGTATLLNEGYWGINAVKGQEYTYSFWAKQSGYAGNIKVSLTSADGKTKYGSVMATEKVKGGWTKYSGKIRCTGNDAQARFALTFNTKGKVFLDMVSLFPPTYKDRPNGMRKDLMERLLAMKPGFMRFPGGCFVEGENIEGHITQWHWKESVGPVEERKPYYNVWRYWNTNGLGFHEYLQLAEDLGAEPLYVTSVGVWHGGFAPHDSIEYYVQDVLDAIEYANGDATTKYGAMRIANGHPEPFNLKMIEIGNENYQQNAKDNSDHYPERYIQFYNAIKAKYPDMKIVANVEALGTDTPSWRNNHPVEIVDEHYFRSPRWFVDRYNHYDGYNRKGPKVYSGEYAVTREFGMNGNLQSAIGEAVYLMGTERNSDVVQMTSYAPLFKNENEARWNPDLIHFNSSETFVTPSYYTQTLMSNNRGDYNVSVTMKNNAYPEKSTKKYSISHSFVYGGKSDSGKSSIQDMQSAFVASDGHDIKMYFEKKDSMNFCVWHLGADGNHRLNLEQHRNGNVSTLTYRWRPLENGKHYDARVEVNRGHVKCFLNDELQREVDLYPNSWIYQSASVSADGKTGYLKIANPSDYPTDVKVMIKGMAAKKNCSAHLIRLTSANALDENSMSDKDRVKPVDMGEMKINAGTLIINVPANSLNIIKLKLK